VLGTSVDHRPANVTDRGLWHPWLRINRLLRAMLHERWSADAWPQVKAEFKKALADLQARSGPSRPPISNNAALRQVRDLLLRITDRRQGFLVGLAELRRRAPQRKTFFAVRDWVSKNREVAEHR